MSAGLLQFPQIGSTEEPRIVTLAEAKELFPLVRRITQEAHDELVPIKQQLDSMLSTDPRISVAEKRYERVVKRWVNKMERLGLVVKGLWLVDFDTGDGYLCWKYPEIELSYYHDYSSGFAGRRPLDIVLEEFDPDWAKV